MRAEMTPRGPLLIDALRERGAAEIDHPGGTLLAHLIRVADALAARGATPTLVDAGLMHAAYGTAGFPRALFGLEERPLVASLAGPKAEAVIYLYCADDRKAGPAAPFADGRLGDRFSGASVTLALGARRDLLELTVVNELDVLAHAALAQGDRDELAAFIARCRSALRALGPR